MSKDLGMDNVKLMFDTWHAIFSKLSDLTDRSEVG